MFEHSRITLDKLGIRLPRLKIVPSGTPFVVLWELCRSRRKVERLVDYCLTFGDTI